MKKQKSIKKSSSAKKGKKTKLVVIVGLSLLAIIAVLIIFSNFKKGEKKIETKSNYNEPQFVKHGELNFIKKGSIVKKIDIEVADSDDERAQGLMYRRSMAEDRGMLFIFDNEEFRSFWMKNTYISLDIIYINRRNEIVSIAHNTTPFSELSIPSEGPAKYVVEVIAGFCSKYSIEPGDKIDFNLLK